MTFGKMTALSLGFVGAFALGMTLPPEAAAFFGRLLGSVLRHACSTRASRRMTSLLVRRRCRGPRRST